MREFSSWYKQSGMYGDGKDFNSLVWYPYSINSHEFDRFLF